MTVRNGAQYIGGLNDGREVWLGGDHISRIDHHPHFQSPVGTLAALFDMQSTGASADLLQERGRDGSEYNRSLSNPRSQEEFDQRGSGYRVVAETTHGLMGRSPDFVNTLIASLASAKAFFAEVNPDFGHNIEQYLEYCRAHDPFVAHASVNPSSDKSAGSASATNRSTHLRVVGKTSDGIVVSGAKMIATLAPLADELLVFPMPGYRTGDDEFVVSFAIPMATPGLTIICREPFGGAGSRDQFDFPLHRFDEMDATIVFDDVLVPWNRVFLLDSVDHANRLYPETTAQQHTSHQGVIRGLAKLELLCGIAVRLAESNGASTQLHVQEIVGEALGLLELYRAGVDRLHVTAEISRWGTVTPRTEVVRSIRLHFPKACNRVIDIIYALGGGSLVATPTYADISNVGSPDVSRYFSAASGEDPLERVSLLKLAWNITGDSFGQRQALYERNLAGDPVRLASSLYRGYPTSRLTNIVDSLTGRKVSN